MGAIRSAEDVNWLNESLHPELSDAEARKFFQYAHSHCPHTALQAPKPWPAALAREFMEWNVEMAAKLTGIVDGLLRSGKSKVSKLTSTVTIYAPSGIRVS